MKRIVGVFNAYESADKAVESLVLADHDVNDIGVFTNESLVHNFIDPSTPATTAGVAVGGLTGLLLGISAITVPGIGPILAGGTLAAIVGSAALGAGAGGLIGAFVDLGFSKDIAESYVETVKQGAILLVADIEDEEVDNVRTILQRNNAIRVDEYDRT